MRESRTSGSGRGDQGNLVPYRHRNLAVYRGVDEGRVAALLRTSIIAACTTYALTGA